MSENTIKNKQQIIDELSKHLAKSRTIYPKWELNSIIEPFLEIIAGNLKQGNEINLNPLGNFRFKTVPARRFYNPNTGKTEMTEEKQTVVFSLSRSRKIQGDNDR